MESLKEDVREYILDQLKDTRSWHLDKKKAEGSHVEDCFPLDWLEGSEIGNKLLNTNYFIIGTWKAKKWLGEFTFQAIERIKEYEQDNFGEIYTDLSCPEKIVNMLSYILGNEILSECEIINFRWNSKLNIYSLEILIAELKARRI